MFSYDGNGFGSAEPPKGSEIQRRGLAHGGHSSSSFSRFTEHSPACSDAKGSVDGAPHENWRCLEDLGRFRTPPAALHILVCSGDLALASSWRGPTPWACPAEAGPGYPTGALHDRGRGIRLKRGKSRKKGLAVLLFSPRNFPI